MLNLVRDLVLSMGIFMHTVEILALRALSKMENLLFRRIAFGDTRDVS